MDDRRFEPLTDESQAREIEAVLAVDPSLEFASRVRKRLAAESARSREWHLRWGWLAGAAAATIAMLALVWESPSGGPSPKTAPSDPAIVAPVAPGPENLLPQAPSDRPMATRVAPDGGIERRPATPDVQVSEAEVAGFRLFVAGIRDGRINGSLFGEATTTPEAVQPFQAIPIPPIAIEPLEPVDLLQGDQS